MSDTVKLIIELPTDKYISVKTNMINDFIYDAVKHGIPLDDVKAEINQFREDLAEKAPSLKDLVNAQRTVDICLGIIDNIGKGDK